jgi:uncharacterized membrane protein YqhA
MSQRSPTPGDLQLGEAGRFVRLLAHSRIVVLLGAFASLVAAVVLLAQSALAVLKISWESFTDGEIGHEAVEHLAVEFLGVVDAILLGTVLYIIALGLYELFFEPDLPVPEWLRFRELSELKESLIEVIVVLLGVIFVARAVVWTGGDEILNFGLATAAVILALGVLLVIGHVRRGGRSDSG